MASKTPYSNPYNLSDEDENQIENVEVQDPGLPRGATISMNMRKSNPWSNPYDLPSDVNNEILRSVAADPGVHRGTTYSAQGDDLGGDDPFRTFGAKAAASIWRNVMAQPAPARTNFLRQVLHKLSPDLWTTVDQAANYQRAQGRNAQDALRIGLEKALSQQMVQDLMSSGWKQTAIGLAGLGSCCSGCSGGRGGLGGVEDGSKSACESAGGKWVNTLGIKCILPTDRAGGFSGAIHGAVEGVASAAKEVATYACSAVSSPLARPAANYGGYAAGGTSGSASAVKGLETAQKVCGQGAKIASAFSSPNQPTQTVTTVRLPQQAPRVLYAPAPSKLPVVPILAVGGLLAFFLLKK